MLFLNTESLLAECRHSTLIQALFCFYDYVIYLFPVFMFMHILCWLVFQSGMIEVGLYRIYFFQSGRSRIWNDKSGQSRIFKL